MYSCDNIYSGYRKYPHFIAGFIVLVMMIILAGCKIDNEQRAQNAKAKSYVETVRGYLDNNEWIYLGEGTEENSTFFVNRNCIFEHKMYKEADYFNRAKYEYLVHFTLREVSDNDLFPICDTTESLVAKFDKNNYLNGVKYMQYNGSRSLFASSSNFFTPVTAGSFVFSIAKHFNENLAMYNVISTTE